ncbi:hypothetical protein IID62_00725 [candidate division KSB1 bacterium]|nr:hypothetical protein [candidate division KSB1 bacterium]MCH8285477.1 hypothetical protein [candidate division KSB1 bacterium]
MMENQILLQELENIATKLDITVRYENGDFAGGLCRVKEENVLIINKKNSLQKKITILSRELSGVDLNAIYILPKLRERISIESGKDLS